MEKKNKVVGIGFHKTGTSTLDIVLKTLGYNVLGVRTDLAKTLLKNDLESVLKIADKYDAYQDNPWPLLYKEIDQRYPGSKFILTLREDEKWISSVVNHFTSDDTAMREWIYGIGHPKGNESTYLLRYQRHNQEVINYFKDRKEDLLTVSWEKGDEWERICTFLGEAVPKAAFPHANRGNYYLSKENFKRLRTMKSFLKKLVLK
jgi:hypothetical protein